MKDVLIIKVEDKDLAIFTQHIVAIMEQDGNNSLIVLSKIINGKDAWRVPFTILEVIDKINATKS